MTKVKHMKQGSLIVLAAGVLSMSALADEQVNKTIDASPDGYVEIYNTAGSIEVTGWKQNKVEVKGTLGDSVEELIFERDGNEVLIRVEVPKRHWGDIDADLHIKVPENSSLEVSAVSADIEVNDVFGKQSLESVSGDIETLGVANDVEAASVSGDIEIKGDADKGGEGDFEAATVSGDIFIMSLSGSVEAESVSGDVDVLGGRFDDVYFESVNGDQNFAAALIDGGELSAESVNGSVEIEFSEPVSASFDIETFNGSIRNCFGPKPERTSKYSPGLELRFETGDGDSTVEIETLNGSVTICVDD
jgi:DUF4097 and DUF4098 domain-containing protein YvlB